MCLKEVYSLRITKSDNDIKEYLKQFPTQEQSNAIKKILKYGIDKLQQEFKDEQYIKGLEQKINTFQSEQSEQMKMLFDILQSGSLEIKENSNSTDNQNNNTEISDSLKKSMQESISIFGG